jgi:hypothetical protein
MCENCQQVGEKEVEINGQKHKVRVMGLSHEAIEEDSAVARRQFTKVGGRPDLDQYDSRHCSSFYDDSIAGKMRYGS